MTKKNNTQYLYHLDRNRQFSEGIEITLKADISFDNPELQAVYKDLFPTGISEHGLRYITSSKIVSDGKVIGIENDHLIEAVVELVRQLKFPREPSRFISLFAFEKVGEAKMFAQGFPQNNLKYPIWKISSDHIDKYDMNWLKYGDGPLNAIYNAEQYWLKASSQQPKWECLMTGNIKVEKFSCYA